MKNVTLVAQFLAMTGALVAQSAKPAEKASQPLANAAQISAKLGNWATVGGDTGHTKYSALRQITTDNVTKLAKVWSYDAGGGELHGQIRPRPDLPGTDPGARRPGYRPEDETLEDRVTPANTTLTWVGTTSSAWNVAANWTNSGTGPDTTPQDGDILVYNSASLVANPTSNKIYQAIGYRSVQDTGMWEVDPETRRKVALQPLDLDADTNKILFINVASRAPETTRKWYLRRLWFPKSSMGTYP